MKMLSSLFALFGTDVLTKHVYMHNHMLRNCLKVLFPFISSSANKRLVYEEVKKTVERDRSTVKVSELSRHGLMEITRKRVCYLALKFFVILSKKRTIEFDKRTIESHNYTSSIVLS